MSRRRDIILNRMKQRPPENMSPRGSTAGGLEGGQVIRIIAEIREPFTTMTTGISIAGQNGWVLAAAPPVGMTELVAPVAIVGPGWETTTIGGALGGVSAEKTIAAAAALVPSLHEMSFFFKGADPVVVAPSGSLVTLTAPGAPPDPFMQFTVAISSVTGLVTVVGTFNTGGGAPIVLTGIMTVSAVGPILSTDVLEVVATQEITATSIDYTMLVRKNGIAQGTDMATTALPPASFITAVQTLKFDMETRDVGPAGSSFWDNIFARVSA